MESVQDPSPLAVALFKAIVRRLGREPSLLWIGSAEQPDSSQTCSLYRCKGCPKCNGFAWLFKTQLVAHLWTVFCNFVPKLSVVWDFDVYADDPCNMVSCWPCSIRQPNSMALPVSRWSVLSLCSTLGSVCSLLQEPTTLHDEHVSCAGHQASGTASNGLAAETVEALYVALVDDEQCKQLLLDTHSPSGTYINNNQVQNGFHEAITSLTNQLTAQLTAAACLARMCSLVRSCKLYSC